VGRRIWPVVPSWTHVLSSWACSVQLRGSTTPVPVDQFLSGQSRRRRRSEPRRGWLADRVGVRQPSKRPASQPATLAMALMRFTERRK